MTRSQAISVPPERSHGRSGLADFFAPSPVSMALAPRKLKFIEAALSVAAEAGYDGTHMRAIADHAGTATGTLYQSFSSKDHLLLAALHHWLDVFEPTAGAELAAIDAPYARLAQLTRRMQVELFATPTLAFALARAYLVAGASAADDVERVRERMASMFANALSPDRASRIDGEVGHLIADVWATNVLAISRAGGTAGDLIRRLDLTISLLARSHPRLTVNGGPHARVKI